MASHADINPLKLSKIVINKFIHLNYVDLTFEKFTSINGKNKSMQGLADIAEAVNFVLDLSELSLRKIAYAGDKEGKDTSHTFVEIDIVSPNIGIRKFKKLVVNEEIFYEIGGVLSTREDYKNELIASEIILPSLNTLIISSASLNMVATLSENTRAAFVEKFSGSRDLIAVYEQNLSLINSSKIDVDILVKEQKELTVEKKKMKKDIQSNEKRQKLTVEIRSQAKQFDLFRMYHNKKFLDSAFDETSELETKLQSLQGKKAENTRSLLENAKNVLQMDKLMLEIEVDENIDEYQNEERSFQQAKNKSKIQQNLFKSLQDFTRGFQFKIQEKEEQLSKLEGRAEGCEESYNTSKYLKLKAEFEVRHESDLQQITSIENVINSDVAEQIVLSLKRYEKSSKETEDKMHPILEKIETLNNKRVQMVGEKTRLETQMREAEVMITNLEKLEKEHCQAARKGNEFESFYRQKIISELKEKFPERVIGRLSEFWTSAENKVKSDDEFIKARLEKFSEAIVVDSKETALECVAFLKIKCLSSIEETFLPLNEFSSQKSSKSFLPFGKIPSTFLGQAIEDLIKASTADVEKMMIYCLTPSLVLDSLKNADEARAWGENKKLNVMSTEAKTCFNKNGFLERGGIDEILTREQIFEAESTLSEWRTKTKRLKTDAEIASTELLLLNSEVSLIDTNIQRLLASLSPFQKTLNFNTSKISKLRANLTELQMDEARLQQQQQLTNLKNKLEAEEQEHFREFCEKLGLNNIQDYQEQRKMSPSLIMKEIELMKQEIQDLNKNIALNELMTEKIISQTDDPVDREKLSLKKQEIYDLLEKYCQKEQEYINSMQESHEIEGVQEDLMKEIFEIYEKLYDNLHQIQMCFKEDYNILMKNLIENNKFPLNAGALSSFAVVPDEVPDGYSLIEQLKLIEVNFERLNPSLKDNVNVTEKTNEFSQKLEDLHKNITRISPKSASEVNQQRVQRIASDLSIINKKLANRKKNFDKINENFQKVVAERKRMFEETIKEINAGIAEFCKLAFDGEVVGALEIVNETEPYLGDIIYYWRSEANMDNRISEIKPHYISSLALLFGILKYKKQKFVVLHETAKNINVGLEKFFERQNYVQVISLTSQMSDDHSNYMILPKAQSFAVTRIN